MTHHEALERSRRALDHRPDCHHELIQVGPDPNLLLATMWLCTVCRVVLSIDPTGIIRDTVPAQSDEMYIRIRAIDPGTAADEERLRAVELFAYLGEDELGSGEIGIKQGWVPAGMIPLVAIDRHKLDQEYIRKGLQGQANSYGKTIRLCRYTYAEVVVTITPEDQVKPPQGSA